MTKSREEARERLAARADQFADMPDPDDAFEASMQLLDHLRKLCTALTCRHAALSHYFGQSFEKPNCGACDVCLGEIAGLEDGTIEAQKILSCVARVRERFGVGHVVDVLLGANTESIRRLAHDKLSTYALLKDVPKKRLMSRVYQLLDQDLLARRMEKIGENLVPLLTLNAASWEVMRGQRKVMFLPNHSIADAVVTGTERESWNGVDRELFDSLRVWRRDIATQRGVPPYLVFSDATLRDLARRKPTNEAQLLLCSGIGKRKVEDLGFDVLAQIRKHVESSRSADAAPTPSAPPPPKRSRSATIAFELFDQGMSVEEVAESMNRAISTTTGYLNDFIRERKPAHIDAWVKATDYQAISDAIDGCATNSNEGLLTRVFESLDGKLAYETIKLVICHRRATGSLPENSRAHRSN